MKGDERGKRKVKKKGEVVKTYWQIGLLELVTVTNPGSPEQISRDCICVIVYMDTANKWM